MTPNLKDQPMTTANRLIFAFALFALAGCNEDMTTADLGMMNPDAGPLDIGTDADLPDGGGDVDEGPGWCDPATPCANDAQGYQQTMGPDCVCRRSARFGNPCAVDSHCGRTASMRCIPRNPLVHDWGICGECENTGQCPGAPPGESFACTRGRCVDGLPLAGDCSDSPSRPFDPVYEDGDELGTFDVGTGPLRHVCAVDESGRGRVSPVIGDDVHITLYTSEIAEFCALPAHGGSLDATCTWCTYGSLTAAYYNGRDGSVCYPPQP